MKFNSKKFFKGAEATVFKNAKIVIQKNLENAIMPFKSEIAQAGGNYELKVSGNKLKDLKGEIFLSNLDEQVRQNISDRLQKKMRQFQ